MRCLRANIVIGAWCGWQRRNLPRLFYLSEIKVCPVSDQGPNRQNDLQRFTEYAARFAGRCWSP